PSSSSSLASTRSRSTTRDLVEIAALDVTEVLEGARSARGDSVQGARAPGENHRALLEHPAPDVKGELLEHAEIQVALREVLEALADRCLARRHVGREHEAHVDVGAGTGIAPGTATEQDDGEHLAVACGTVDQTAKRRASDQLHARIISGTRHPPCEV